MRSGKGQQPKRHDQGQDGRKRIIKSECPIVIKQKTSKRLSAYQRFLNSQLQTI